MCEPGNHDNAASDVWALTAYCFLCILLKVNRAGSTGQAKMAQGPRQLFKFSNCALARWTWSIHMQRYSITKWNRESVLKGKFSSGIEGALASTLNGDFNWKQLSEMILCIFCDVFKVYLINIDSETAEILKKRRLWILGMGVALYYDLI